MFFAVIALHIVMAIAGLLCVLIFFMQRPSYLQKLILVISVCSFVSLVAYLFELLAETKEAAFIAVQFGYMGKCYVMVLYLAFIVQYCEIKVPRWVFNSLFVFSTFIFALVMTSKRHKLYYSSVDFVDRAGHKSLILGKGPFYYIFMLVTLAIMAVFMFISFKTLVRRKGGDKRRLELLCMSCVLPALGIILNFTPWFKTYDVTPLGISLADLLGSFNVLKYGLLDTIQIASENVFDYSDKGIIVTSNSKRLVYANAKAYELFEQLNNDYDANFFVGEMFEDVEKDIDVKKNYNIDDGIYEATFMDLQQSTGSQNRGTSGYMAFVVDKTKEYLDMQERERLREEAENANMAKTAFLAKMSHEIRTPMNGIMGFADLALGNNIDEETTEYLKYIKSSAVSLLSIINDVLDISKIESGKLEIIEVEYDPKSMFADLAVLIKTQADIKNLEIVTSFSEKMPKRIVGDSIRLREIITNMLSNAVKYTEKGTITFSVDVSNASDGVVFEVHVIDTGIGIRKENIDTIFDSFEQADTEKNYYVEGTGLGLSIAKQLAEMMGGSLSVTSEYGKGSDFKLLMPQKYVEENQKNENEKKSDESNLLYDSNYEMKVYNVNALIVDDNDINLKVEKGILNNYGINADLSTSGKDCLEKVQYKKYDIIFLDHMMPEMDGVEVFNEIRSDAAKYNQCPIILVTANAILGVKQDMINLGFDGFISKPIDIKQLEAELLRNLPNDKVEITVAEEKKQEKASGKAFREMFMQEGINVDEGLKYCGRMSDYLDILSIVEETADGKLARLYKYFEEKDWKNYTILVHSIKSGLANIGAIKVSDMARELEMAGKSDDIDYILKHHNIFLEEYTNIINTVKNRKKHLGKDMFENLEKEKASSKYNVIEIELWNEYLAKLDYHINELETEEACDIVDEMLGYNVSDEVENLLLELKNQLGDYDMEGAKVRINALSSIDSTC